MTTTKTSSKPAITPETHDANVGQRTRDSDREPLANRGSAKLHGDDLEAVIPRDLGAYRRDPLTDEPEEQANVGQRLTGNKNAGAEVEGMSPVSSRHVDRPTRDDGDNDDRGDLSSRASGCERGYPRG